jgi:hypothetical protein
MTLQKNGQFGMLAVAADLANVPGPDGEPYNIHFQFDTKWHLHWTNYDPAYGTDFDEDGDGLSWVEYGPGVSSAGSWYSGDSSRFDARIRHRYGGLTTDWVGLE